MNKQILTLTGAVALFLLGLNALPAQSLRGFNYQAVARDAAGNLLANQNTTVVFDIRQGTAAGALIYQETHNTNTNAYGLINLVMGKGTPLAGSFAAIDWSANDYFLGVTLNGSPLGASALEAVPYSKIATDMRLNQLLDVSAAGPAAGEVLKWNGSNWAPATDEGTTYSAGAGLSLSGTTFSALDPSPTNEIQTLSLSGNALSLSLGGGSVNLPTGTTYTPGDGIAISGANAISATLGTSIQTGEIDNNAVTEPKIAANAVTTAKIADNAVTTAKIANSAVTTAKLNQSGAANGQVLKWNGTAWAPAADDAGSASQWTTTGSNIHYTTGNVGIGDATAAATLTVGNGDKFQVSGTDGDVLFTDPQGSIRFPAVTSAGSAAMIQMFASGTVNADRMVIAHSPGFPLWGLEYKDTTDAFFLRNNSTRHFSFNLAQGRMGIGLGSDALSFPLEIAGRMRLRSTGNLNNSPGIWFNNNSNTFSRAFFGMSEPDSIIGIFSQHMNKWAIEFEIMREPRIGINIPAGSPPRAELHLYHTNFGGSDGVRIQNEGANGHYWNLYTSNTTGDFEFFKQGIKRATINQTSGAYTAVSDARLKTNITALSAAVLPSVMKLQAKTYQYIDVPDKRFFTGFLAQELEPLFPQFVYHGGDDQVMYTVDYAGLSVVALKAIQEQQAEIESQQEVIETQQSQIQSLQGALQQLQQQVNALMEAKE